MRFELRPSFPDSLTDSVSEMLSTLEYLLPIWMQVVYVSFESGEEGVAATMEVRDDYRFADLTINASWLSEKESRRKEILLHEILHCYTFPIFEVAMDEIRDLIESGVQLTAIEKRLTKQMERSTQDLTIVLAK